MGTVRRGLARFALMAVGLAVTVALIATAFALLGHFPIRRGISVAYYAVGALITMVGVLHGLRPPVRVDREQGQMGLFGIVLTGGQVRRATVEERDDALGSSALFVVLGVLLVILGGLLDPNHRFI